MARDAIQHDVFADIINVTAKIVVNKELVRFIETDNLFHNKVVHSSILVHPFSVCDRNVECSNNMNNSASVVQGQGKW